MTYEYGLQDGHTLLYNKHVQRYIKNTIDAKINSNYSSFVVILVNFAK